jgi:hypothetical protein
MDQEPKPESLQEKLKTQLLAQQISPEEFLEKVRELDQSTPSREEALKNITILEDPSIKAIFDTSEEMSDYKAILSLTQFHIGQIYSEAGSEEALSYFQSSLASVLEVDWDGYEQDCLYIGATVAYLKSDIGKLDEILVQMEEGRNKVVVGNLLQGLKERGRPDYSTDYSK